MVYHCGGLSVLLALEKAPLAAQKSGLVVRTAQPAGWRRWYNQRRDVRNTWPRQSRRRQWHRRRKRLLEICSSQMIEVATNCPALARQKPGASAEQPSAHLVELSPKHFLSWCPWRHPSALLPTHSSRRTKEVGVQRRRQLVATHRFGWNVTHSGVDGGVLPKMKPAEAALHRPLRCPGSVPSTAKRRGVRPDHS